MSNWKNNLTNLIPYKAGEQVEGIDVVKLNANENPYPPSPAVEVALKNFNYEDLNKYPSLEDSRLDKAVASYHDVGTDNIFCGNSSDEVLSMCFRAFFNSDKPILFPDITYSFYPVWCSFYDIQYMEVPLTDTFEIDVNDYIEKNNGGIIIPNPNAPTAIEMSLKEIEKLVSENSDSVIVIDEAYSDFGDVSAVELTKRYENLLVTKTFSKSRSLAGLRVGYAVGSKILIDAAKAAMHSFNAYPVGLLSMELAAASMEDKEYFKLVIDKIKSTRERTKTALMKKGFEVTESKTNFLFVKHEKFDAEDLYKYLFRKNILIRYFKKKRIEDYLRISIGTDEEMALLLDAVDDYMEDKNAI